MRPFCIVAGVVVLLLLLRWAAVQTLALAPVAWTITVDQRGGGQYTTVQAAVNAVPDGNFQWVRIHVRQGSYWEKVTIPSQKGFIFLEGDGSWTTDISFNVHAYDAPNNVTDDYSSTYNSATFTVQADNFIARNIAFKVSTLSVSNYEKSVLATPYVVNIKISYDSKRMVLAHIVYARVHVLLSVPLIYSTTSCTNAEQVRGVRPPGGGSGGGWRQELLLRLRIPQLSGHPLRLHRPALLPRLPHRGRRRLHLWLR
jgi:hypothetical protein